MAAGCAKRYSSPKCCALLFSDISKAASELAASPERHQETCYEVCASTPEHGVPLLWTPIRCNQPRQHRRMRRRAATRSGSTHGSLASRQTECPCRFTTCDGSTPDLSPAHSHRLRPAVTEEHRRKGQPSRPRAAAGDQSMPGKRHRYPLPQERIVKQLEPGFLSASCGGVTLSTAICAGGCDLHPTSVEESAAAEQ